MKNRLKAELQTLMPNKLLLCVSCYLLLVPQYASAHPFHISTAEMEYSAKTGKYEVSLKLHAVDLESAVGKLADKKVDLEKEEAERLLQSYLAKHFYITTEAQAKRIEKDVVGKDDELDKSIARSKLKLIGKEFETSWIWLYFEITPPKSDEDLALVNSVLIDTTDGQINTVSVRHATGKHALKMNAKKSWAKFSSDWLPASMEPWLCEQ